MLDIDMKEILSFSLGSDHDGYYRGKECDPANGFIMSSIAPLDKSAFFFSQCTVNSIKENLLYIHFFYHIYLCN